MKGQLDRPAGGASRRGEQRRRLRLAVSAGQGEGRSEVDILNISRTGLLVSAGDELALDEPVVVVLPLGGEQAARIVWNADELYGCRFEQPLSPAQLSAVELRGAAASSDRADGDAEAGRHSFGARLRELRLARKLTMIGLARSVGVSKPTLWKWETDRVLPRRRWIGRVAAALGVDEAQLLREREMPGAHDHGESGETLAQMIGASRNRIAARCGVAPENVSIMIDWG